MAEPTLADVFGGNASQTTTTLTIEKSDLAAVGLTASATNSAESLLAALLVIARSALSQSNFESNLDQSVTILPGFNSIVSRDNGTSQFTSYRQTQLNVNFHKLDDGAFNPDDY